MNAAVEKIKADVEQLSDSQQSEFNRWYSEFFNDFWDRQFEEDVKAGRLDHLAAQAIADDEAGLTTPL